MTENVPNPFAATDAAHADPEPVQRIEEAIGRLDDLDQRPVAEHAAAFEDLHTVLVDALAAVESTIDEV